MRQSVSLSLPETDVKQMKNLAAIRGYESVSAYVKHLLKADQDLISEKELIQTVRQSRKEYKLEKSIKAKSISELL